MYHPPKLSFFCFPPTAGEIDPKSQGEVWKLREEAESHGSVVRPGAVCGQVAGVLGLVGLIGRVYDLRQVGYEFWDLFCGLGMSQAVFDLDNQRSVL